MKRIKRIFVNGLATVFSLYVLAFVVSHILVGCESAPRALNPQTAQTPQPLRVMTYNVHYAAAPDAGAEVIRKTYPDVVFLQESTTEWEKFVQSRMTGLYPHAHFHHDQYAGGMAILSRYPITPLFYEMPPMGWFNGWGATIQTHLGPVNFLGVHLRPGASGQGGLSYLNVFRLSTIHPQEIEFLYRRLQEKSPPLPTIVLGDFNESDAGKAIQYLEAKGFTNALGQFDKKSKTWHGRHFGIALSNRVDHVLYSSDFRCLDAAVLAEGESDHLPVVAVVEAVLP